MTMKSLLLGLTWLLSCSKRLSDMMTHMKERLAGKIGNANNNAFMLRKLFKMYDTAGSGYVSTPL